MFRPLVPLLIACALSTLPLAGCPARTIRVDRPIIVEAPPCHRADDRPPTQPAGVEPFSPAWVDGYAALVAWAWRVHRQCRGPAVSLTAAEVARLGEARTELHAAIRAAINEARVGSYRLGRVDAGGEP